MKWLLLALFVSTTGTYAQDYELPNQYPTENPTENPTSQPTKLTKNAPAPVEEPVIAYEPDYSAPSGLNLPVLDGIKALFFRVHTLSIEGHIKDMKRDGVSEREYVAGFTAEGAIAYDHELWGKGLTTDEVKTSRKVGFQALPYKVSLHNDGTIKIAASAVGFKNMNSAHLDSDVDYDCSNSSYDTCIFKVIDNLSFINFEYDKDVARGIKTSRLSLVNIDLKLSLLKSEDGSFYMALKAGGTPVGFHWTEGNLPHNTSRGAYYGEVRYGVEFGYSTTSGWRIIAGMNGKNRFDILSGYDNEHRHTMILNPYLQVSKKVSGRGKNPVRIGLQAEGNFYVEDKQYEQKNGDLIRNNGQGSWLNANVFVNY